MKFRSYKTELDVNNKQYSHIKQLMGCARFVYNWALAKKLEVYNTNKKLPKDKKTKIPSYVDLSSELTKLIHSTHSWLKISIRDTLTEALKNVDAAFEHFFKNCKKSFIKNKGFPKFKSKKKSRHTISLTKNIKISNGTIALPKLGIQKIKESDYLPQNTPIRKATLSEHAGHLFVSVLAQEDDSVPSIPINQIIGVDLGIKELAATSNNEIFANPSPLRKNLKKLRILSRNHSRKKPNSKNKEKARQKLAKLHYHIANIRKDTLHKATSKLIDENQVIVLEDLKVSNMLKNDKLSRAIADVGFFEFRRQIEYKAKWNKREVVFVPTFYPSSKLCSNCGNKKEDLTLKNRVYKCNCGLVIDRDLNAAINLKNYYTNTVGFTGIHASGEEKFIDSKESRCSSWNEENNIHCEI